MINQLRIYDVPPANRAPFFDRFRDHAAGLMAKHGFAIQAMWTADTDERCRFVYLLAWPDEDAMKAGWEAFMADEQWKEIKRVTAAEHGDFVLSIEDIKLEAVPFSNPIGDPS